MEKAKTIIAQLGNGRFMAMTGAKNLVATENGLMFSLPRNASKINKVVIALNGLDLYDVTFYNLRGVDCREIKTACNVYGDNLQSIFTEATGLDTRI